MGRSATTVARRALQRSSSMAAYSVGHFTITDRDAYQRYVDALVPNFGRFKCEMLAFDYNTPILEGNVPEGRTVIMRFPDLDVANAWYRDPAYQRWSVDRRAGTAPHLFTIIGERPQGWTGR